MPFCPGADTKQPTDHPEGRIALDAVALVLLNPLDPGSGSVAIEQITGRPVGSPPPLDDLQRLGEVQQARFEMVSASQAGRLGFGFGEIADAATRQVISRDFGRFALQDGRPESGVEGWTYGVGYRIGILSQERQTQGQFNLASLAGLAASVTLQSKDIRIQVLTYGLPDAPVCPFADLSSFDVVAYGKLMQWEQAIGLHISDPARRSGFRPVRISASAVPEIDRVWIVSAPLRYALERLRDREPLAQALQRAPAVLGSFSNDEAVRAVYRRFLGNPDLPAISEAIAHEAEKWIRRYDVI
jgi:hypothetical protein